MTFQLTIHWILEKLHIPDQDLDDIKSLSLPGRYDEKINFIGSALTQFSRLKNLDLSRNALVSLDGLQHLKCLESLNLYYNCIDSLQELLKLHQNPRLVELDVRLNPVSRNEPDYRLHLIQRLPHLEKLDDREVSDSERRAVIMHFGSAPSFSAVMNGVEIQSSKSDIPCTQSVTHDLWTSLPTSAFHSESYDRKDLLKEMRLETDVGNNPQIEDKYTKEQRVYTEYTIPQRQQLKSNSNDLNSQPKKPIQVPHLPDVSDTELSQSQKRRADVFSPSKAVWEKMPPMDAKSHNRPRFVVENLDVDEMVDSPCPLLEELSRLADKYWNGSGSLMQNSRYQELGKALVLRYGSTLVPQQSSNSALLSELNATKKALEEARKPRPCMCALGKSGPVNASSSDQTEQLRNEVTMLHTKLKSYEHVATVSSMLQESHKSLMQSNEHLIQELQRCRQRDAQ